MKSARAMRRQRVQYNRRRRALHRFARLCQIYPPRFPGKKFMPRWDVLHPRPLLVQLGKHAWKVQFT